jgi:extradiol dioxygenase family protein
MCDAPERMADESPESAHGLHGLRPFHLAFGVHDLGAARRFYGEVLGCPEGRSDERWVDFDLFGHQIVAHLDGDSPLERDEAASTSGVDGKRVPVPHFGVVLDMESFGALASRLRSAGVTFVIEPYVRFQGQPGEQATMFFLDPSGNALEFKAFRDTGQLFAR